MSKKIHSYSLVLKTGAQEDKIIRNISPEGGEKLKTLLAGNPPMFIPVKGRMVARAEISQLVPHY